MIASAYKFLGWVQSRPGGDWAPGPEAVHVATLVALGRKALAEMSDTTRRQPSASDPSIPLGPRLRHLLALLSQDEPDAVPKDAAFAAVRLAIELVALGGGG